METKIFETMINVAAEFISAAHKNRKAVKAASVQNPHGGFWKPLYSGWQTVNFEGQRFTLRVNHSGTRLTFRVLFDGTLAASGEVYDLDARTGKGRTHLYKWEEPQRFQRLLSLGLVTNWGGSFQVVEDEMKHLVSMYLEYIAYENFLSETKEIECVNKVPVAKLAVANKERRGDAYPSREPKIPVRPERMVKNVANEYAGYPTRLNHSDDIIQTGWPVKRHFQHYWKNRKVVQPDGTVMVEKIRVLVEKAPAIRHARDNRRPEDFKLQPRERLEPENK